MKTYLAMLAAALVVIVVAVVLVAGPAAQAPATSTTKSGMLVEEVRVGGSCVVIVSRAGAGASDHVAAVPCRP